MHKIYSKVVPDKLLHIIHRFEEITELRNNIIDSNQFLQLASMKLPKGYTFKPHHHFFKDSPTLKVIPQESWVVLRGSVKCVFYDIDNKLLEEPILKAGDCSVTLEGGHTYVILEDDTIVYEYKTGPYEGVEKDKIFID
jgi:cupin fold WbuC family metalloprotein